MNETTELQANTPEINVENTLNKTFHIYDYFKDHPSFLLALISTFIAALSILLNFLACVSTNSYLTYFEVDKALYKPATQFVYSISTALFYSISCSIFHGFLSRTFECYLPYKRIFLLHNFSLKNIKKKMRTSKKDRVSAKKRLRHIPSTAFSETDSKVNIQQDLIALENTEKEIKNEYTTIKKEVVKTRILFYILICFSCILMWIALSISGAFLIPFSSYKSNNYLLLLLVSFIQVLFFAVINWFFSCFLRLDKKKIKKDAENRINIETYFFNDNFPTFPIALLFSGKPKDLFHDSNCKRFLGSIILGLLTILLITFFSTPKNASKQTDFFIINIDSQEYALIYNNGENAVLEKVEFSDKTITIDTTYQKIIPASNIDMRKVAFENANILRIGDTYSKQENANFAEVIYQKAKNFIRHMLTHIKSLNIPKNKP